MKWLWMFFALFRPSLHETTLIQDGEPVDEPIKRDKHGQRYVSFTHKCCDCGLRHTIIIAVERRKLTFYYMRKDT